MLRSKPISATPPALTLTYSALPGAPDEADFLTNPEKLRDLLPQPFRLLDRILGDLLDDAWAEITKRENRKKEETERVRPPQYECKIKLPMYGNVSCLASTSDGKYVFAGSNEGIAALDASSGQTVSLLEDEAAFKGRIEHIEVEELCPGCYVLAMLDETACARLIAFAHEKFYLLKTLNGEDGGANRTMALKVELSKGADFAGMVVESTATAASHTQANADALSTKDRDRDPWLEVFRLPREIWVKELEAIHAQVMKQAAADKAAASSQRPPLSPSAQSQAELSFADGDGGDASAAGGDGASEAAPPSEAGGASTAPPTVRDAQSPSRVASVLQGAPSPSGTSAKGPGGYNFNKPVLILKIKKPLAPQPSTASSPHAALKNVDQGEALGFGANNMIFASHLEHRKAVFQSLHSDVLRYQQSAPTPGSPGRVKSAALSATATAALTAEGGSRVSGGGAANLMMAAQLLMDRPKAGGAPGTPPNFHFLLPGLMCPAGVEHANQLNIPNVVMVWWPGMSHMFMYSLLKPQKADTETKAEIVIPTSAPVAATSISPCTLLLAVGLRNGNVSVWDRNTGLARVTTSVPETDGGGGIRSIFFLSPSIYPQQTPAYPPYHMRTGCYALVLTEGTRSLHLVDCAMAAPTQLMLSPKRVTSPAESAEDRITDVKLLSHFPSVVVTIARNGVVSLLDVLKAHIVAQIVLPQPHLFVCQEPAILTAAADGSAVYLRGVVPRASDKSIDGEVEIAVPMSRLEVGSAGTGAVRISADSVKRPSGAQVSLSSLVDTVRMGSGGGAGSGRLGSGGSGLPSALKANLDAKSKSDAAMEDAESPALFCLRLDEDLPELTPKKLSDASSRLPFICSASSEQRVAALFKSRMGAQAARHVRMQARWSNLAENREASFEAVRRTLHRGEDNESRLSRKAASTGSDVVADVLASRESAQIDMKSEGDRTRFAGSSISVFN